MYQRDRRTFGLITGLLLLCLAVSAFADTGMGRHKKIYIVPASKHVTIDGKLDDWDLSGQITMYVTSETSDMQNAKFALMYDKDALYVSGVVRDSTPMMNRHDPKVDADRAWDADACQFRLTLDPSMGYPINIGLALQPGQQLRMDLGLLYGNATGNQISARSYWMNNSFNAHVTNDVPCESRLEPAEWGTVVVE